MLLSDLAPQNPKDVIKECKYLIRNLVENPQQSSKPRPFSSRVIMPGLSGVIAGALEHLKNANHQLDKLDRNDITKGQFDPNVYKEVMHQLIQIRNRLRQYKEAY